VLLKPVLAPYTYILWFAAPGLLLVGAGALFVFTRNRRRSAGAPAPMSPEEAAALKAFEDETGPARG
jgi:cytochrome c-type biogenesis protein CcmH